jgi:hypothetical protein
MENASMPPLRCPQYGLPSPDSSTDLPYSESKTRSPELTRAGIRLFAEAAAGVIGGCSARPHPAEATLE